MDGQAYARCRNWLRRRPRLAGALAGSTSAFSSTVSPTTIRLSRTGNARRRQVADIAQHRRRQAAVFRQHVGASPPGKCRNSRMNWISVNPSATSCRRSSPAARCGLVGAGAVAVQPAVEIDHADDVGRRSGYVLGRASARWGSSRAALRFSFPGTAARFQPPTVRNTAASKRSFIVQPSSRAALRICKVSSSLSVSPRRARANRPTPDSYSR